MTPRCIFAGAILLAAAPVFAQQAPVRLARHPESGSPLITSYAPREVGGAGQIWAVIQDARGVIYASSSAGVIEYDGASWRLIPTSTRTTVRSLALDHQGRIYVGAVGEFGYLAVDATGAKHFVSLLDRVPADARRFEDVWRIWVTPQGVYFQTQVALFRWADNVIRVWKAPARFNRSSYVRGRMLLTQPGLGITEFDGETFRTLPGTERFSNEVYPIILPYDEKRSLIGTRTDGLFLYDGTTATGFPTDADDFLKNNNLYRGFELPDGSIALTTTGAGMGVFNREGRLLETVNRSVGLADDSVYYVFPDREGALWLGLANGLARVETPSPASTFQENAGLRTAVQQAIRHRGTLYVATAQGVQYLRPAVGSDGPRLVPVSGMPNQTWWLLPFSDPVEKLPTQLLVAGSSGLYRIDGDTATPIRESVGGNYNAAALLQSAVTPNRVYVGLFDGLASYRWSGHQWIDEGRIANVSEQMRSFAETKDGRLWVGTQTSGVTRLRFDDRGVSPTERPQATVEEFGDADGLEGGVFVKKIGDEVYFLTRDKIFRFNESDRRFVLADDFMGAVGFNDLGGGLGVEAGPDGRAYVNVGRETAVGTRGADGSYSFDKRPFARFAEMGAVFSLYAEPDGVLWLTLPPATLVRYDSRVPPRPTTGFSALIRKVTVNQDTVIAGGDSADAAPPRLASSNQALRVEFAAPTFGGESGIEYQSILEGLDDNWSDWSREPRRDYTNLGLGDYRFKVRARNQAGDVSQEAVYAFTILPPWYRTWAAYAAYLLLAGVVLFAADRVMRRRVVGKERERAQFAEAKYRAEAAEALAHSESERKRNVELISEIGREITASLDFETIFGRLYERVNQLADADVFGVGLFHPDKKEIEYRLAIERGTRYAPYTRDASDPNQFPVWCIEHRQPVFINDVEHEYSRYIGVLDAQSRQLEDGTMSRAPQSLIYLPLTAKDRVLGIITIQSFEKNAYTEHHLNVMQSLAAFASIGLDNADAYRQLNDQEHEIRRLFEEAERARSAAEEADAAKSAFLSTVSHELRTPLTSVLGFAKIIKKRLDERLFPLIQTDDRKVLQTMQQVQENLQVVVGEGERLTKLIDDVLDLAKIEAGKLEWHMDNVVLSELIDHATAATASLLDHKGLQLVKEVPANLPVVTGDRDRLIQVVINLISNAVKFTETGSVTCRAERRDNEIVISVTDTGMGIAPADQPKVFERFKQVGDTLTDKPKGTGLGLPISREIVEHHGGRIWVTSDPGRGSTFAFSLPVGKDARATTPVDLAAIVRQLREHVVVSTPRMTTERAPRILVVDDEQNIRDLLTQEFVEAGYQVTVAANGRDAVQEVRRQRPDLIVLDVMMPEMNGFDVAAVLKNDPQTADIPIVILSIVQDRERGFRLGVDRYLTKPIDTDLLFKEVGELITQKKSHRRVLIVDDDAPTVKALSDVLKGRGYSVTETRDADLFETAKSLQPDVIMLNSVSPRPDVVQMLRFEKGLENVLFLVYQ